MSTDTEVILYDNVPPIGIEIAPDDLIPVELVWFDVLPAELGAVLRGLPGPPGPGVEGALMAVNALSEFDNETKKAQARGNLDLQNIDGGTFN